MERGFDLTFPRVPLTGQEKTLEELIQPDERSASYSLDVRALQAPYLELEKWASDAVPPTLKRRIEASRQLAVYGYFCYEFHAVSMFWSISCIEMALKLKFRELNAGPFALVRSDGANQTIESCDGIKLEQRLHEGWRIPGMEDFDCGFGKLLAWAFSAGLLPNDLPIPLQEITNSFESRFTLDIFFNAARKHGLIGPNPTLADIKSCWFGLTEEQREGYLYKPSGVLIEELPRLSESLGHPSICDTVSGPRSSFGAYELLIDIVSRLWPDPTKPKRPETFQRDVEPAMPDKSANPEVHAERITLYDSIHIPAGSQIPERITFSFGADGGDVEKERLFDLGESQMIEQVVTNPMLMTRFLEHLEIEYPNCWIITEILTRTACASWPHPKPGDIDIVCGRMKDGRPDLDYICGTQVKVRKVKTLAETGDFASGAGTEQSHWTAKMGFDRTLLLHWIVRVPQSLPEGYSPSWNAIINTDFERAAKGCYGTIRQRFEKDRELHGFGWLGWGQAYGQRWDVCGGFSVDLVCPPPHRPALDSDEAKKTRGEMINSFRSVISAAAIGPGLPVVIQRKGK